MTGGQNDKHEPVQFDFVGVSIANQYRVWPCEFTTTVPMLVWRVETGASPRSWPGLTCSPAGWCSCPSQYLCCSVTSCRTP